MAGDPWGVVVVPVEGDPGGLLAPGQCGAMPPCVRYYPLRASDGVGLLGPGWVSERRHIASYGSALPLWWDGALVPEGWDRVRRALFAYEYRVEPEPLPRNGWWRLDPTLDFILVAANDLLATGRAARVVLLDRTSDGSVVERL